mgnify:FL=1
MTQAIGYTRVSTATQLDGSGLDMQRERIAAWCAYQGVALADVCVDEAVSGAVEASARPGLRRALRAVLEDTEPGCLVVYKLDRLGRDAIDVQETLAVLLDAGVRVVSIVDGVDSASGMGAALLRLLTSILASFAEAERETIRTRLRDGRLRAKADLRTYASEPGYGLRTTDGGALATDEHEAALVARARELAAGGMPLRAIGAQLLAEGFAPRRAAAWSTSVLRRLVKGEREAVKRKASPRIARARDRLLGAAA